MQKLEEMTGSRPICFFAVSRKRVPYRHAPGGCAEYPSSDSRNNATLAPTGARQGSASSQLPGHVLGAQVSVAEKLPHVPMPADQGHFSHAQTPLEEPADRFVP